MTFVELHPEHRARERLDDLAFDLDLLFLDCHPSLARTPLDVSPEAAGHGTQSGTTTTLSNPIAQQDGRAAGRLL